MGSVVPFGGDSVDIVQAGNLSHHRGISLSGPRGVSPCHDHDAAAARRSRAGPAANGSFMDSQGKDAKDTAAWRQPTSGQGHASRRSTIRGRGRARRIPVASRSGGAPPRNRLITNTSPYPSLRQPLRVHEPRVGQGTAVLDGSAGHARTKAAMPAQAKSRNDDRDAEDSGHD